MNDIIQKNIDVEDENTFLYLLHEEGIFDEDLFHEYMESVSYVDIENTEKEVIKKIIVRNEYIVRNALCHFLPDDVYTMKNFPSRMSDYIAKIDDENTRLISML